MADQNTIAIIGAGAWGTALANAAERAGRQVILYVRNADTARLLAQRRINAKLPGVTLGTNITVTDSLSDTARARAVLVVTPAQHLREATSALAPHLEKDTPVVACAKGIEHGTHAFMTDVIAQAAPKAIPAILSGPSFAIDVARGLPTAVTLATANEALASELVQLLGSPTFRPYRSTDVRGVEIGGAAKNVLAIGTGIVAGKGLGLSAAAALTTRGFAELARFGTALGARAETLTGLSGLGDLMLSASSPQSRNFSFGVALGQGQAVADIHKTTGLAEGAFTAPVLLELAREKAIDMPITAAVAAVIAGKVSVDSAVDGLLNRPFKAEAAS